MFARHPVRILALAALALALPACAATSNKAAAPQATGALDRLLELHPSDVAVAPIRDQTQAQRVPVEVFRRAFVETLIERLYTPLATAYVDANWIDASFKGTPPPDCVLSIAVTAWDPSHLFSTGRVSATFDVALFEGADTTGTVLWQVSLSDEVDLGDGQGHPPGGGQELIPVAMRRLAQKALQSLPMRDPVAAHSAPTQ